MARVAFLATLPVGLRAAGGIGGVSNENSSAGARLVSFLGIGAVLRRAAATGAVGRRGAPSLGGSDEVGLRTGAGGAEAAMAPVGRRASGLAMLPVGGLSDRSLLTTPVAGLTADTEPVGLRTAARVCDALIGTETGTGGKVGFVGASSLVTTTGLSSKLISSRLISSLDEAPGFEELLSVANWRRRGGGGVRSMPSTLPAGEVLLGTSEGALVLGASIGALSTGTSKGPLLEGSS